MAEVKRDIDARGWAWSLLGSLCPPHSLRAVVVEGDPVAKGRPRFTLSGRAYTPAATVAGEERIAARLRGGRPFASNVAVVCVFYRASRRLVDVDNLLKAVLDGGNRAAIWGDDSQVTALVGLAEYDPARPRTIICLGEHRSTLARGEAAREARRRGAGRRS